MRNGNLVPVPLNTPSFFPWKGQNASLPLTTRQLTNPLVYPQLLRNVFDRAQKDGFNVVRTWAHAVSPEFALQTSPGGDDQNPPVRTFLSLSINTVHD